MRKSSAIHGVWVFILIVTVSPCFSAESGIIYSNPRVYNVDYSFEMVPDPNKIDRNKDLKLWIPIPREWDSQKATKIVSVQPAPHAEYVDPEHGNHILFWDFGREPEQPCYKVHLVYRLESFETHAKVDINDVHPYDKSTDEYSLYTRSTRSIRITPKIRELAQKAIGDEKNPYLMAKLIHGFARKHVRYSLKPLLYKGRGTNVLLEQAVRDEETGEEYYEGDCGQTSLLFIAMCRALGIPARSAAGFIGYRPGIGAEDLKLFSRLETEISPEGLAGTQHYLAGSPHGWVEFYIQDCGWIPADPTLGQFGNLDNKRIITEKGSDIQLGPDAPRGDSGGYGLMWFPIQNGRADCIQSGIWNIAKIRIAKAKLVHHSDPFPADGLASGVVRSFSKVNEQDNYRNWRKEVLSWQNWPSRFNPSSDTQSTNLEQVESDYPKFTEKRHAFICDMLRRQLGDEQFNELLNTYFESRQKAMKAVPSSRFQELAEDIHGKPLGWFFSQWLKSNELPRLKLERIAVTKINEGFQVHGRLLQSSKTCFHLPVELATDTKSGRKTRTLWLEDNVLEFNFQTLSEPERISVDPEYRILRYQKMNHLSWFWYDHPEYIVVYGTLREAETNKIAAERFSHEC